ncbi:NAD+ synthase [Thalassospira xiamenensis]|uniref:Glutamine-dependent NAD(+) synthetase n=1 Tax=Thalassospira xiamenensis TaxID=220697 RepID=A0A285TSM1_9PROT|nr:NAD+ synthase [Thalassospira xiamenensis]SOC26755.1 NAD+ synthase [Thalassospira xiamenensis]
MSKNYISITCAQENPKVGSIADNLDIVRHYRKNLTGKTDLIVFSEGFATGYPLQDLALSPVFLREFQSQLHAFADEVREDDGPAVLIGGLQTGAARPFNTMFLIETDGSMKAVSKQKLANNEVYDEVRTFEPAGRMQPIEFRGFKLGIMICEDFWHTEVSRYLADEGADILIVPNGSHYRTGKQNERTALCQRTIKAVGLPVLYVNQYGGQDETIFDGGSMAFDANGEMLFQLPFTTGHFAVELNRDERGHAELFGDIQNIFNDNTPRSHSYPDPIEADYSALVLGVRDYVGKNGFPGVVIGMSGGLDSALTATIAVDALGADKVCGIRMPSIFTSDDSMTDARVQAELLDICLETVPIAAGVQSIEDMMSDLFAGKDRDVTEENMQARMRAMVLMAFSNKFGHLVLSTGNKTEISVGYSTLYGDMCGGYNALKDVLKTRVREMANWRNWKRPKFGYGPGGIVVPTRVLSKAPTAELSPNQTDEETLGSYEILDAALVELIDNLHSVESTAKIVSEKLHVDLETATWVTRGAANRLVKAEYKRRQSCPGPVISKQAFDKGWRRPITNGAAL